MPVKTPYDAALRWRKSELDLLRRQISELQEQRDVLLAEMTVLEKQFAMEESLARLQPLLQFAQYATRSRHERTKLQLDADQLEADIADMQDRAADAFADFKSLDIAARNYQLSAARTANAAEQNALDDIAARNVVPFARTA